MREDSREWDEEVIQDLFNIRDQICIRNIKLRDNGLEDHWYWSKEHSGDYSVRSAYRLLQAQKGFWRTEDSDSLWSKVWRVKAPPKALNTIWRALSKCLPTMTVLWEKFVPVETLCPVCKGDNETIIHALVECPFANQCWRMGFPDVNISNPNDFFLWLQGFFHAVCKSRWADIVVMIWTIWKTRNELVWNQKNSQVKMVVDSAKYYLKQWRNAQTWSSKALFHVLVEGDGAEKWVKPQMDITKVNVDAAIFRNCNAFGFGIVARDHMGGLIRAKSIIKQGSVEAGLAEVMAIKEALSWIKEEGWQHVYLETDCLVAAQAIRSNTILFFIKRSANMAAHVLARVSYFHPDRIFSRGDVPTDVLNVLASDLS